MIICGLLHQQADARLQLQNGTWVLQGCLCLFSKEDTSRQGGVCHRILQGTGSLQLPDSSCSQATPLTCQTADDSQL